MTQALAITLCLAVAAAPARATLANSVRVARPGQGVPFSGLPGAAPESLAELGAVGSLHWALAGQDSLATIPETAQSSRQEGETPIRLALPDPELVAALSRNDSQAEAFAYLFSLPQDIPHGARPLSREQVQRPRIDAEDQAAETERRVSRKQALDLLENALGGMTREQLASDPSALARFEERFRRLLGESTGRGEFDRAPAGSGELVLASGLRVAGMDLPGPGARTEVLAPTLLEASPPAAAARDSAPAIDAPRTAPSFAAADPDGAMERAIPWIVYASMTLGAALLAPTWPVVIAPALLVGWGALFAISDGPGQEESLPAYSAGEIPPQTSRPAPLSAARSVLPALVTSLPSLLFAAAQVKLLSLLLPLTGVLWPAVGLAALLLLPALLSLPGVVSEERRLGRSGLRALEILARNLLVRLLGLLSYLEGIMIRLANIPLKLRALGGGVTVTARGPGSYQSILGLLGYDFGGKKVADIGSGGSGFARAVNLAWGDTGALVVPVDLTHPWSLAGVRADAKFLPFADGAFDLVVSNMMFQWLTNSTDALTVLEEMVRMTAPGGEIRIGYPKTFTGLYLEVEYLRRHPAVESVLVHPLPALNLGFRIDVKLKPQAPSPAELRAFFERIETEQGIASWWTEAIAKETETPRWALRFAQGFAPWRLELLRADDDADPAAAERDPARRAAHNRFLRRAMQRGLEPAPRSLRALSEWLKDARTSAEARRESVELLLALDSARPSGRRLAAAWPSLSNDERVAAMRRWLAQPVALEALSRVGYLELPGAYPEDVSAALAAQRLRLQPRKISDAEAAVVNMVR